MDKPSAMEQLPEELLVHVFSYLDFKDLCNMKPGCKHFQNMINTNSKRMKKHKKSLTMSVAAILDSNGNRALEIMCGDPEEQKILFTDTEIKAKEPFYMEWMEPKEKILEKKPYKKMHEKHLLFLESLSRALSDGRPFGPENPLPSTSLEIEFQETLTFFLRRFNLDLFGFEEYDRKFTREELNIILTVLKATGPSIKWMRRTTETIDDTYMEIIQELRCKELMFCGYHDEERRTLDTGEYSVDNRILQVPCELFCFYEPAIISVSTMLQLLKQWKDGIRRITSYTYHHYEDGMDWYPLVKNDFKIIKEPEDIIWTCNATIELQTFTIARDIEAAKLEFFYYGTYLEIKCHPKYIPQPVEKQPEPPTWDDDEEDLGFGLFD